MTSSDKYSKYEVEDKFSKYANDTNEEPLPQKPLTFTQRVAQELSESEDLERQLGKTAARQTIRSAEGIAGIPGGS